MVTQTTTIQNEQGFHLRPAQLFSELAGKFESDITFTVTGEDDEINPKSILGLMALGLEKGTSVTITAEGPDEEDAVKALIGLIDSGFGE
jgi:phosphotransferase system HPr (HPr) family protein